MKKLFLGTLALISLQSFATQLSLETWELNNIKKSPCLEAADEMRVELNNYFKGTQNEFKINTNWASHDCFITVALNSNTHGLEIVDQSSDVVFHYGDTDEFNSLKSESESIKNALESSDKVMMFNGELTTVKTSAFQVLKPLDGYRKMSSYSYQSFEVVEKD